MKSIVVISDIPKYTDVLKLISHDGYTVKLYKPVKRKCRCRKSRCKVGIELLPISHYWKLQGYKFCPYCGGAIKKGKVAGQDVANSVGEF